MSEVTYPKLEALLAKRLDVIADHAWRDRDAESHLQELKAVSEALDREFASVRREMPPRLAHFMQNASYSKALAYLRGDSTVH